jgi:diguanylate cyclase (GGDEF)-like protein
MSETLSKIQHFFLSHDLNRLEKLLFIFIVLTCIALYAENTFIKTRLILQPGSSHYVYLSDDRANGGASVAEWVDEKAYEWRCTLRRQYQYPYCQFHVDLDNADLSKYDTMTVTLEYSGAGMEKESIRVSLRNYGPLDSKDLPESMLKLNEMEIPVQYLKEPFIARMSDFNVPDWWLRENNIPPQNIHAEYNDVGYMQIGTGTDSPPGEYRMKLLAIEWEGNLIPPEKWYFGILVAWLTFMFGVLVYRLWHMKSEIDEHYSRAQDLQQLNRMLDIKSRYFEKMARTDVLTGISNRAGIGGILVDEIRSHMKSGQPLSLIMLDIDHFKSINDNHGHDYGDTVLVKIAKTLVENLRARDTVARWGGEEFLLLCPHTPLEHGESLAEKLRLRIKELSKVSKAPISASFGVAMLRDESIDAFIKRVDEALYKAKQNGRDRVEVSES